MESSIAGEDLSSIRDQLTSIDTKLSGMNERFVHWYNMIDDSDKWQEMSRFYFRDVFKCLTQMDASLKGVATLLERCDRSGEVDSLMNDLAERQLQIDEMTKEFETKMVEQTSGIDKLRMGNIELISRFNQINEESGSWRDKLEKAQEVVNSAKRDHMKVESELNETKEKYQNLERDFNQIVDRTSQLQIHSRNLEQQSQQTAIELQNKNVLLESQRNDIEALTNDFAKIECDIDEMVNNYDHESILLNSEIEVLRLGLARVDTERRQWQAEKTSFERAAKESELLATTEKQRVDGLANQMELMTRRMAELEAQIHTEPERLQKARQEGQEEVIQSCSQDRDETITRLRKKLSSIKLDEQKSQRTIKHQLGLLEKKSENIAVQCEELETKEHMITDQSRKILLLEGSVRKMGLEVRQVTSEATRLHKERSEQIRSIAERESELESMRLRIQDELRVRRSALRVPIYGIRTSVINTLVVLSQWIEMSDAKGKESLVENMSTLVHELDDATDTDFEYILGNFENALDKWMRSASHTAPSQEPQEPTLSEASLGTATRMPTLPESDPESGGVESTLFESKTITEAQGGRHGLSTKSAFGLCDPIGQVVQQGSQSLLQQAGQPPTQTALSEIVEEAEHVGSNFQSSLTSPLSSAASVSPSAETDPGQNVSVTKTSGKRIVLSSRSSPAVHRPAKREKLVTEAKESSDPTMSTKQTRSGTKHYSIVNTPATSLVRADADAAAANAQRIFSLFRPGWNMTVLEQGQLLRQLRGLFSGTRTYARVVKDIDKHVVGDFRVAPAWPRPCLFASLSSAQAGVGGSRMTANSCTYCQGGAKDGRICCWAQYAPGVASGYPARGDDGKIRASPDDHNLQAQPFTVVSDGSDVRWVLLKRKEKPNDELLGVVIDGVSYPVKDPDSSDKKKRSSKSTLR